MRDTVAAFMLSVRALAESLPRVVAAPGDLENHGKALYGAWLAGLVLGSVGMALLTRT